MLVLCALPARANLVSNGSFTGCNGSLTGGCSASNFAIGTSGGTQTVYNLTSWTMSSTNNLHCVAVAGSGGAYSNNFLCGSGWTGGTTNLQMFALPGASPDGGNYVLMDGDPKYSGTLSQTLTGLIVGKVYSLSFYQSAGQQTGNSGNSTDFWKVTFTKAGGGATYNTFGSASQNAITVTSASTTSPGWQQVTYTFTASATSEVLNFLSVGASGVPPYLFLDGVDVEVASSVPEPGTLSLLLAGLMALPLARRRNQRK